MAKKKEETPEPLKREDESFLPKKVIPALSVDFAREDLNTIARKINEVIEHVNAN